MELTNLPLIASFTVPSTQTTSYSFHSPFPLQRNSRDMLRLPRGLSGVAVDHCRRTVRRRYSRCAGARRPSSGAG